jgi:hypothetical protein
MKHTISILFAAFLPLLGQAFAQDRMYRCDNNYYTNSLSDAKALNCKLLEGGNVTVVQGTRMQNQNNPATGSPVKVATSPQSSGQPGQRVDAGEQRTRDSDSKVILESELKKAESRRQELAQEYNNGEPDKRGDESRNYQKYLDRVSELKTSLQRLDNDIAGIRRELNRSGSGSSAQR